MARVPQWRKPRSRASALDERPSCGHGDGPRDRGGRAARARRGARACAGRRARRRGRDRRGHGGDDPGASGRAAPTRKMSRSRSRVRWPRASIAAGHARRADPGRRLFRRSARTLAARAQTPTPTCSSRSTPMRCAIASISGASVYMLSDRGASSEAAQACWPIERTPPI